MVADSLQPVRLVVYWVWRSYHVRTTSDVSPVMWEQNPSHRERSWPWGSVFVMCVNFLDVRWDEVLSILCLASSWLLWVISYNAVASRPYKPTGWFYLHWRPGGIKRQAGMAKQAGLPLNPTEWGGKHELTPPSIPSDTQASSTAEQPVHLPEKLEDRWENT